jgi:hypothetical protein
LRERLLILLLFRLVALRDGGMNLELPGGDGAFGAFAENLDDTGEFLQLVGLVGVSERADLS